MLLKYMLVLLLAVIYTSLCIPMTIREKDPFESEENFHDDSNQRTSDPWDFCRIHPSFHEEPETFLQCEPGTVCKYNPKDYLLPQTSMICAPVIMRNEVKREWIEEILKDILSERHYDR